MHIFQRFVGRRKRGSLYLGEYMCRRLPNYQMACWLWQPWYTFQLAPEAWPDVWTWMESGFHSLFFLHRMVLYVLGATSSWFIRKKKLLYLYLSRQCHSLHTFDAMWKLIFDDPYFICIRNGVIESSRSRMDLHDGAHSDSRTRIHRHYLPRVKLITLPNGNNLLLVDKQQLAIFRRCWVLIVNRIGLIDLVHSRITTCTHRIK